jgi:arylsulfatase A
MPKSLKSYPSKIHSVAALALLIGSTMSARGDAPQSNDSKSGARPNIVLIMADDMGYECVGANGGESYKTPHLDKLAATSMRFTHCYSQPICTPSRVQIMTGIYNSRNYIRFGLLDPRAKTFGHVLKRAGYATCVVGKWQLLGGTDAPSNFGFDEHCLWQLTRRPSRYPNPGLEINGKEVDFSKGEYGPDIVSDYLCSFIERNKDRPFLAYYPMMLPHWPFEPTPGSADWNPNAKGVLKGHGDTNYFGDMVAYTDKMVGKIIAKLDGLGIRDNTLVLFTCDNGTYVRIKSKMNGETIQGGKGMMTDAGTHVPLIASWPNVINKPSVCDDLIDFSDILPTLAETGGAAIPKKPPIDGRSFAPQLRGEAGDPRQWIYCWYYRNGKVGEAKGGESARTKRYKLYTNGRFFKVENDRLEQSPLAKDQLNSEVKQVRTQLQEVLDRHTRKAGAKIKKKKKAA